MNLFIGNLNPQTSEDSLRTLFSEFGEIVSVKVPVDAETGMPRGFGFVEMADKFEGFDAIDNIDGIYFEGQVITVKESKPKGGNNRGGGHRGGGGGFRRNNNFGGGRGGYNSGGGGGYRKSYDNDRGGSSDRGGYGSRERRSEGGGYERRDRFERGSGGYDRDRRDRGGSDDPNRQPGRRFSPRGPRPNKD